MAPKSGSKAAGTAKSKTTAAPKKSAAGVRKNTSTRKTASTRSATPAANEQPRRSGRLAGRQAEQQQLPARVPVRPRASRNKRSAREVTPEAAPEQSKGAEDVREATAAADPDFIPGNPLATVDEVVQCQFGAGDNKQAGLLGGVLQVFADGQGVNSRLEYRATFDISPDDMNADEPTFAGIIDSWRIDGATNARPSARASWIEELLVPTWNAAHPSGKSLAETRLCLQGVYNKNGRVKAAVPATHPLRQSLMDDGLIFIEMVGINEDLQGQGLLRPMLQCFRSMLQRLPEWFAFNDLLLLVPAPPDEGAGEVWAGTDDAEIENILTGVYQRTDQYQVLVSSSLVANGRGAGSVTAVTVMGRRV
ncbi:Hypothetical predicted protein [Lecanosticta acicola]|uniref:Uncharacterized protein n=1 Tax=Lecanosticta acicola TaxID=111012 RepID=A0AAI8YVX5_9PEZI|nr:Hypothetical predicted protein [Lecanosticta acicola]